MSLKHFSTFLVFFGAYLMGACSGVRFSQTFECEKNGTCIVQNGKPVYPGQDVVVGGGKVDILIVTDNSASMSFEQNRMAERFSLFLNNLDSKSIDYRIAFTTTDISTNTNQPRAINQNGALQDGHLIPLSSGLKFLSPADGTLSQRIAIFNSGVKRPETLACEKFINDWISSGHSINDSSYSSQYDPNCPSGDERGIYAANLVINNNPEQFLRDDADLQIIFLSDEDERSQLYLSQADYALADLDQGAALPKNIRAKFPNKNFGIHPIITADAYCLPIQQQQMNGVVGSSYGLQYNDARKSASTIINGERSAKGLGGIEMVLGDICNSDYSGQLQKIFDNVQAPIVDNFALKCGNPEGLTITVSTNDSTITHQIVGNLIQFNKKLPVGTHVSISSYSCPNN
jgi:hypothetical protein